VVLRGAFRVAPVLTSVFALLFLLGVLFLSGVVPNTFVGIAVTLRRRIRVGDRVKVGSHEGVVREIGLTQLHLRGADGSTVLVPNRLMAELPVVVERARNSVPVRVRLKVEHKLTPAQLERLRQIALLSPYRAPDSLIDVSRNPEDEYAISVEIQAWSGRAQRDARAQLESALRRELA
jgi:small-conductance mechanosensitive channel